MAQFSASRSSKALFSRHWTLLNNWEFSSKAYLSEFHSFCKCSFDVNDQREALGVFRRPRWLRGLHDDCAITTAATVTAVPAFKSYDTRSLKFNVPENTKVLEGDVQARRARAAPLPLHVTANASIGNSRNCCRFGH